MSNPKSAIPNPKSSRPVLNPKRIKSNRNTGLIFEDFTSDYINVLGLLLSICGILMRIKWCGWLAIYCSCIGFASTKSNEDYKQIISGIMLSISSVVTSYLHDPSPMTLPFIG